MSFELWYSPNLLSEDTVACNGELYNWGGASCYILSSLAHSLHI
jgi:hypothetical protein